MRTITAVDLRNDLEGIVKSLKRGETLELTYRGEKIAEMLPVRKKQPNQKALEALHRAWELTDQIPDYDEKAAAYIQQLREDRAAWGERTPS
jgi:antitoxin (DNA-binding transcriptional repressor) of toxin-antitoxin stability system